MAFELQGPNSPLKSLKLSHPNSRVEYSGEELLLKLHTNKPEVHTSSQEVHTITPEVHTNWQKLHTKKPEVHTKTRHAGVFRCCNAILNQRHQGCNTVRFFADCAAKKWPAGAAGTKGIVPIINKFFVDVC